MGQNNCVYGVLIRCCGERGEGFVGPLRPMNFIFLSNMAPNIYIFFWWPTGKCAKTCYYKVLGAVVFRVFAGPTYVNRINLVLYGT